MKQRHASSSVRTKHLSTRRWTRVGGTIFAMFAALGLQACIADTETQDGEPLGEAEQEMSVRWLTNCALDCEIAYDDCLADYNTTRKECDEQLSYCLCEFCLKADGQTCGQDPGGALTGSPPVPELPALEKPTIDPPITQKDP